MPDGIKKIFATTLTDIGLSDKEGVGTIRREGDKTYKYIKYEQASAAVAGVAGEVAYYATIAVGDNTATIVTSDLSDSDALGAGVLQAALTDGDWGWIQIKGIATLTIGLTAGSDGSNLTPTGASDGTLDLVTAVTDHVCAVTTDQSADIILCDFPY